MNRRVIGGIVIPRDANDDTTPDCEWLKWWKLNSQGFEAWEEPMREGFLAGFEIAAKIKLLSY